MIEPIEEPAEVAPAKEPERISVSTLALLAGCAEEWIDYLWRNGRITKSNREIFDSAINQANEIVERMR